MTMIRVARSLLVASASAFIAAASLGQGAYGDGGLVGPPIGNNRYTTTISAGGDQDDFTATLVAGDRLDVIVAARRGRNGGAPSLRPLVVLVDPEGLVVTAGYRRTGNGLGASLRGFRIDKSGLWAVRVSGRDGTAGDADVTFSVKAAPRTVVKGQRLGGDATQEVALPFEACAGARLDVTLVTAKGSAPVELASLRDAYGADVVNAKGVPVVASAVERNGRIQLRGVTLTGAAGTFALRVRAPSGKARYDLTLSVTSPRRPSSTGVVKLSAREPRLNDVDEPIVAAPGSRVRFSGANFSTHRAPSVLFDGVRAKSVVVGAGGRTLDVLVPARRGPSVVAVAVVNPDHVGTVHPRYLAFIPPPECADLVDAWTRAPVRATGTTSNRVVSVLGAHFEAGYRVLIGGVQATSPVFVSGSEIRVILPVVPQGDQTVTVSDAFGRSGTSDFMLYMKTPPSFAAAPFEPGAVPEDTPMPMVLSGAGFTADDQLWFGGQTISSTFVDSTTRVFELPPLASGSYAVRIVDSVGTAVDGPPIISKLAPTITAVAVTAGDVLGTDTIPLRGGTTLQVDGTNFLASDIVTLGGTKVTSFLSATSTRKVFLAPAGTPGPAGLLITDAARQHTEVSAVVTYAGLADVSSSRAPSSSSADDFTAVRGAAADLDGDGLEDDVVLVAPLASSAGSRSERTRVLIGDASGSLKDTTATAVPSAYSDPAHADSWDATCLAIGDLDGSGSADIVIGGEVSAGASGAAQVRWLSNDGSGGFALVTGYGFPTRDVPAVTGEYYSPGYGMQTVTIFDAAPQRGRPQAIAIGDINGDGALDVVVGTDQHQARNAAIDPSVVDFTQSPPAVASLDPANYRQYIPATRIYENRTGISEGLVDVSLERLPSAGVSTQITAPPAALVCRDLVLTDVNNDGKLDLVVAWDDPTTVTAYGLETRTATGTSADAARTATRILLNTGGGRLTDDATDTWMPAASGPEHWQADRIAAADLNGDGYPELVLVMNGGLDRYTGSETHTRTALRVLRNDRTKFTDITATAIPAVDSATQDDWRGGALAIRDVDGDGKLDIVVGTTNSLNAAGGVAVARTRVLFGRSGLTFARAPNFAERTSADTGEADDILFVGDLAGPGQPVMMLVSAPRPSKSPATAPHARTEEWKK